MKYVKSNKKLFIISEGDNKAFVYNRELKISKEIELEPEGISSIFYKKGLVNPIHVIAGGKKGKMYLYDMKNTELIKSKAMRNNNTEIESLFMINQ